MSIYKPRYTDKETGERVISKTWWYKFVWHGELIRKSTETTNKRAAEQIEAAKKVALAKGEVGIVEREPAPTLRKFAEQFRTAIETRCAGKPRTIAFYKEKFTRLLEYPQLAGARLDEIDEAMIEGYVQHRRKKVSPGTVNRQLATLRRALRLAQEWKLIDRVPHIRMLDGERNREFVLTQEAEKLYLATAPQPLEDLAVLMLDTGLRVGEALELQTPDVHLEAPGGAKYGYLHVRGGKSKNAKRNVSLTARVSTMLKARIAAAKSLWVFDNGKGGPWLVTSIDHIRDRTRTALKMHSDFVIHSFRHTMLTRLGEAGVDAFTIMRIAGHSSITASQRYVHPSSEAMERAFEKLEAANGAKQDEAAEKQGVGKEVGIGEKTPAPKIPYKSLN